MQYDHEKQVRLLTEEEATLLWPENERPPREVPESEALGLLCTASQMLDRLEDPAANFGLGLNSQYFEEQREHQRISAILHGIIKPLEEEYGPVIGEKIGAQLEDFLRDEERFR